MNRHCSPTANAFPLPTASEVVNDGLDGLTKQEYFASQVLARLVEQKRGDVANVEVVQRAVEYADLLIAELNKPVGVL